MHASTFYSVFLIHCLRCLRIFPTKVSHPSFAGSHPQPMHNLGWGFTVMNLPHAPSFDSSRKAEDILKDAIIRSTRGGPVSKARVIPAASTSTAPVQVLKNAKTLLLRGLPPSSPPAVCSPSKCKCTRSPSPQRSQSGTSSSGESLASGRGSRGSRSSSSSSLGLSSRSDSGSWSQSGSPARSEASVGAQSVCLAAASVRSIKVLSGDEASESEHDISYSTDEADVSQGSIPLLDISASDDDEMSQTQSA